MLDPPFVLVPALLLVLLAALLARRARGPDRLRMGAWLVVAGLALPLGEDAALTAWYALAPPSLDPDGVAGVAPWHTRAHMLGSAGWLVAFAVLVVWLALGPLRRGEAWAWRALRVAFLVGASVDLANVALSYSHGLPLPTAAEGADGFGWSFLAAGLVAWAVGLALTRPRARPS